MKGDREEEIRGTEVKMRGRRVDGKRKVKIRGSKVDGNRRTEGTARMACQEEKESDEN